MISERYMNIDLENIINGLKQTKWAYRMQRITSGKVFNALPKNSIFYIDGAHNISAAKVLTDFLISEKEKDGINNYIINGRTKDTDSHGFLKQLVGGVDLVVAVRVKMEALPEDPIVITKAAQEVGLNCVIGSSLLDAVKIISCKANNIDINMCDECDTSSFNIPVRICICGSFYLARDLKFESA